MKIARVLLGGILTIALCVSALGADKERKPEKVPSDLALLTSLRKSWIGVACTGQLSVSVGDGGGPVLNAPVAVAYYNEALKWVAFVTPPAPCAGTVVLGQVKVGPGNKPQLKIGTPPGMVIGNKPALLSWRTLEKKDGEAARLSPGSLCGGDQSDSEGTSGMFGAFAGGMGHRPDSRTWDPEHPELLRLEGTMKGDDKAQQGRYVVWLDKNKGYLPVKSVRTPAQGAPVSTSYEPREIAPGHWLPVRWQVSGAGRPTMTGEFQNLRCDRPLPETWFDQATYPDVASESANVRIILDKP